MAVALWLSVWTWPGSALLAEDFGIAVGTARRTPQSPPRTPSRPVVIQPAFQPSPPASPPALSAQPVAKTGALALPQSLQSPQSIQSKQLPQGMFPHQMRPETKPGTPSVPLSNVVRLIAFESEGQSFGSGAYIGNFGEYGLVLSNWHVIREAEGLVHIHFSNGFSTYGAVLALDQTWDLVLIAISKPPQSIPVLPVARSLPRPGDPLWIAGYGPGEYRSAGGRCVRYLAPEIPTDGSAPLSEIIEVSVSARQGDSGGPILNAQGELAGVLFGSDMVRNTAGSGCERVMRFLRQSWNTFAGLPSKPEEYFARIENGSPKRMLLDSRNAVVTPNATPTHPVATAGPLNAVPTRRTADMAGSATTFGIRPSSRRYVQAAP